MTESNHGEFWADKVQRLKKEGSSGGRNKGDAARFWEERCVAFWLGGISRLTAGDGFFPNVLTGSRLRRKMAGARRKRYADPHGQPIIPQGRRDRQVGLIIVRHSSYQEFRLEQS